MDEYAAVRGLRFIVRVGMDLLDNITNLVGPFVAKVIERVRQAVYSLCVGLHKSLNTRGGGGGR